MASRQRQRTERTRLAFLTAARDLLLEQGYTTTSVADIVRRGGRAHGTFYRYFDNKHDVFAALLIQLVTRLTSEVERPMTPAPADGTGPSEQALSELVRLVNRHRDLWRLIEEMSATDSAAISARLQVREAVEAWFIHTWTAGLGETTHADPNTALLGELVTGSVLWRARTGDPLTVEDIAPTAGRILQATLERSADSRTP